MSTTVERVVQVDTALLNEKILEKYCDGIAVAMIQQEFGLSRAQVIGHINGALENRLSHKADEAREIVNKSLDQQMELARKHLDAAEQMLAAATLREDLPAMEKALGHHLKAIEARTRIIERRAKLNGLDAPVRIDAKVEMSTPADAELQALLNEAHQRAEADRQRLAEAAS